MDNGDLEIKLKPSKGLLCSLRDRSEVLSTNLDVCECWFATLVYNVYDDILSLIPLDFIVEGVENK